MRRIKEIKIYQKEKDTKKQIKFMSNTTNKEASYSGETKMFTICALNYIPQNSSQEKG